MDMKYERIHSDCRLLINENLFSIEPWHLLNEPWHVFGMLKLYSN
jgi:hypothetical protein